MSAFCVNQYALILTVLAYVWTLHGIHGQANIRCPSDNPFGNIRDPENCAVHYRCVFGKAVRMGACGAGAVYNLQLDNCVHIGSQFDDCGNSENTEFEQNNPAPLNLPQDPADLAPRERCVRKDQAIPHPSECGLFYNCSLVCKQWTKFLELLLDQCPPSQWFSTDTMRCEDAATVNCGSRRATQYPYSRPVLSPEGLSPQQACDQGASLFPHPHYCNAYYNCSHVHPPYKMDVGKFIEQHLLECPYPQFFRSETLTCEDFSEVDCGSRKETKNLCEYRNNLCERANCRPCFAWSAICENVKDGPHYMECQLFDYMYVECKDERMLGLRTCAEGQVFSPISRDCVDNADVPADFTFNSGLSLADRYYKLKDINGPVDS